MAYLYNMSEKRSNLSSQFNGSSSSYKLNISNQNKKNEEEENTNEGSEK